jgi:hypothetical protein
MSGANCATRPAHRQTDWPAYTEGVCGLPSGVKQILGRADSGFYCWEAVEAYQACKAQFVISARKTSRLVEQLRQAEWKPSKQTDAEWGRAPEVAPGEAAPAAESEVRPQLWRKSIPRARRVPERRLPIPTFDNGPASGEGPSPQHSAWWTENIRARK